MDARLERATSRRISCESTVGRGASDTEVPSGNSVVHPIAYDAHSVEMLEAGTEVPSGNPCAQTHGSDSPEKVCEAQLVETQSVEVPQAVT